MSNLTTARDMIFQIRQRLGGPRKTRDLQVVDILMAINMAKDLIYDDLSNRNPDQYYLTATFSTVTDQPAYSWPAGVKRIEKISIPSPGSSTADLQYTPVRAAEVELAGVAFSDRVFYRRGAYFVLNPAPATTGTNNGSYLYLPVMADLVKEADALTFPQGMINCVLLRAAWDLSVSHNIGRSAGLRELYTEQLAVAASAVKTTREQTGLKIDSTRFELNDA